MKSPRRGIPKYLTLEFEACEILESMASGKKHQGALVSSLLRQEEARREELRKIRRKMTEVLDEVAVA